MKITITIEQGDVDPLLWWWRFDQHHSSAFFSPEECLRDAARYFSDHADEYEPCLDRAYGCQDACGRCDDGLPGAEAKAYAEERTRVGDTPDDADDEELERKIERWR